MGKGKGHVPIRTCISCGAKKSKGDLIRLVVDAEGRLVRDEAGNRPGRGGYICKEASCRQSLSRKKGLERRFRSAKPLSIEPENWS